MGTTFAPIKQIYLWEGLKETLFIHVFKHIFHVFKQIFIVDLLMIYFYSGIVAKHNS